MEADIGGSLMLCHVIYLKVAQELSEELEEQHTEEAATLRKELERAEVSESIIVYRKEVRSGLTHTP